jgi:hypothetical protein
VKSQLPDSFHPHVGLTDIALTDEAVRDRLPDDSRLQPIDAAVEAQLKAMLKADSFDAVILAALRPASFDREVLAPSRFHTLRDAVLARMQERLSTTPNADEAAELRAATDLLRARGHEHELGQTLRYALIKG